MMARVSMAFLVTMFAAFVTACGASNDFTVAPSASALPRSTAVAPPPLENGRLPTLAKPTRYTLELAIDPKLDHLSGKVRIALDIPAPTDVLVLHGRDLTYKSAAVVDKGEALPATLTPRASIKNIGTPDELVVALPRKVDGSVELVIEYTAVYTDQLVGAYKTNVNGDAYVFTQFEPMDARRAFPCFDEPGFKVPFELTLAVPAGNIAVANTLETSRKESDDKKTLTFTFAPTKPLPTYLIAFAVGPLEILEAKGTSIPLRVITVKGKSALGATALDATKQFLTILEAYFGRPYPYDKLDLVAVPDFQAGAMENAGFITFREELILVDSDHTPASAARNVGLAIAHELSHHWFGDLVTMAWWDDLWLNEGFATWMETRTVDAWRPELGAGVSSVAYRTEAMTLDARPSSRAVRRDIRSAADADEAFDAIIYDKGAAVLGMLETWLGPTVFQNGVREYLKTHAYGSATAADLFLALGQASGKDVASVAASYFDKPGIPLVSVELDCKTDPNDPKVVLHEERLVVEAAPTKEKEKRDAPWKVPVCIDYDGSKGASNCTLLEGSTATIDLGKGTRCPKWIAPNVDEHGYYRYALSPDLFRALAKASVSARTRFGVLDNAAALVEAGRLGADVLFDLVDLERPAASGKPTAADALILDKIVSTLSAIDPLVADGDRDAFSKFAGSILIPTAKTVGWDPKKGESDDIRLLRRDLFLGIAPLLDDPWLTAEAGKRVTTLLEYPRSVDADTATPAAIVAARRGDAKRFDDFLALAKNTPAPQLRPGLLLALGSFGDPALARRGLDLVLDPEMKKQDGYSLFRAAARVSSSRPIMLAWLKDHAEDVKTKVPSFMRTAMLDELVICDDAGLASAHQMFDGKLADVEGGARSAEQLFERAELCIAEKKREADHIAKRLRGK